MADCAEIALRLPAACRRGRQRDIWKRECPRTADTLTQDRQRLELGALSAPAVVFTRRDDRVSASSTRSGCRFRAFRRPEGSPSSGLANYAKLIADNEFWHGLWVTLALYVLSMVLQLVFGVWLALILFHAKRLPGIVRSLFISPFMMPPVVAGMMWLVILDPSLGAANYILSVAWPAAVRLAGLADLGDSDDRPDRHLAMDALCGADRAGRPAVAAAERL